MTPFGMKLRNLRLAQGKSLKDFAKTLKVSSAYLSALEHGKRGKPTPGLVQQVAAYFNLAWDEVDELRALAEISDPKISVDTAGLSPQATECANLLAQKIGSIDEESLRQIIALLKGG